MINKIIIICLAITMTNYTSAQENNKSNSLKKKTDISMFPAQKEGFQRLIIELDTLDIEENFKVEIYSGKELEVDCNKHSLSGDFEKLNLKGWGYSYYNFNSKGNIRSTMMACPDGVKKSKFIASKSILVRYNSKLPIVLYVPNGYLIKYKIWNRSNIESNAIKM